MAKNKRIRKPAKFICTSECVLNVSKNQFIDWIAEAYPNIITFDNKFGGEDGLDQFNLKMEKFEFFDEPSNRVYLYGQPDLYAFLKEVYGKPKVTIENYINRK